MKNNWLNTNLITNNTIYYPQSTLSNCHIFCNTKGPLKAILYFFCEQSISRVLYHFHGDDYLSSRVNYFIGQATQPGRSAGNVIPSLFGLASDGVYQASRSPDCWCALTAPFHPYHLRGGFLFYGTFPGVTPAGRYPASCPAKLGLSSRLTARNHLSCSQGTV